MTNAPASLDRLGLLASAISGRALQVAPGAPGEPAWTDGRSVFVDAELSARDRLEALVVQAALLAAGSLGREVLPRLSRRPALVRRYLAVEGHRALASIESLLPRSLRALIDSDLASRADSPAASLALALSRDSLPHPPGCFGAIRSRELLATIDRATDPRTISEQAWREEREQVLSALAEDADEAARDDPFSSPVGGGGVLGRLLQRMLAPVRRLDGGGPSGVDAPTHRARGGTRGHRVELSVEMAGRSEAAFVESRGARYPEWDLHLQRYRKDWCTVQEIEPRPSAAAPAQAPGGQDLRRPLARLALGLDRCHRQAQGDDIDLDAAIEARVTVLAGAATDETVYVGNLRRRRDLAVLILLDVSESVGEPGAAGRTVHEQQRAAAAALTTALHEIGDRVALYAYQSRGRSAVRLMPVKRFHDALDSRVLRRLHGLVPGAYSRLGAAIRHAAAVLEQRSGAPRRLLLVLSDGLAYDHGYEPGYGAADARRALAEARRRGTGCLCLSLGASTDVATLRRVFGSAAHATIPRTEQLGQVIGPLFRSALRSAEVWRR